MILVNIKVVLKWCFCDPGKLCFPKMGHLHYLYVTMETMTLVNQIKQWLRVFGMRLKKEQLSAVANPILYNLVLVYNIDLIVLQGFDVWFTANSMW